MKLTTEPTELQKKTMGAQGLAQALPQWYVDEMSQMELKVYKVSRTTKIPVEDIMRFWGRTLFSLDDVCMIFSAHGIHAFEEYGIDRYPRVCEAD